MNMDEKAKALRTVPVTLSDGATIAVEILGTERETEVAWKKPYELDEVLQALRALGNELIAPLRPLACDGVELELSLALTVASGKLTALLVSGEANASVKVTLRWGPPAA